MQDASRNARARQTSRSTLNTTATSDLRSLLLLCYDRNDNLSIVEVTTDSEPRPEVETETKPVSGW
jgi:hypothetical protein